MVKTTEKNGEDPPIDDIFCLGGSGGRCMAVTGWSKLYFTTLTSIEQFLLYRSLMISSLYAGNLSLSSCKGGQFVNYLGGSMHDLRRTCCAEH